MFKRLLLAPFCALFSSCATMPTEAIDHVSLAAVEERVKCEIGAAFLKLKDDKRFPDLSTWAAGLTLTLAVDSTGGVTPATSLTGPFGSVSPLDVSLGASLNAKRTALLNVYVAFLEAATHACPPPSPILLEGQLGLGDWIVRVFEAQYIVDQNSTLHSGFNSEKSIGYTMEFLITLNAGVTPNFVLTNATNTKVGLGVESKSTNSVDIAMVQMDPADFRKRFTTVVIKGKTEKRPNPEFGKFTADEARAKNIKEFVEVQVTPDRVERRPAGVEARIGIATRFKLDQVLQQLNNKILIQSLRR
ncbi:MULTISPECIES: hypothetical protein [Bradyrhizobium]|uniref:hypothetical protein n=1 Tax=Bradyrhizobium TaxID=374 RepID=UPI003512DA4D